MVRLTKKDFIRRVAEAKGLTLGAAGVACDAFITALKECLIEGKGVQFQMFGTFDVVEKAAREHVNPSTGGKFIKPAHKAVRFKISDVLRHEVEGKL